MIRFTIQTLILSLLIANTAVSQSADSTVVVLWDMDYSHSEEDFVNDISLLTDGRIMAVGKTRTESGDWDGLFILVNASGQIIFRRTFGVVERDEEFLGGTEAFDATFYLVGRSSENLDKLESSKALIIRTNFTGKELPLKKNTFGNKGKSRFSRIRWKPDGVGIAAGFMSGLQAGNIQLFKVQGPRVEPYAVLGDGRIKDLVVYEPDHKGGMWLAGNARKSKGSKKGDIWVARLGDSGFKTDIEIIRGNNKLTLYGGSGDFDGNLLLAGQVWASSLGDSDGWVYEYKKGSNKLKRDDIDYVGTDAVDYASVFYLTPRREKWMVMSNKNTNSLTVQIYKGPYGERAIYNVVNGSKFDLIRLLQPHSNKYILSGNGYNAITGTTALRLVCIEDKETYSWKGTPKLECIPGKFTDDNQNAYLEPEEHASIRFSIKNTGTAPLEEGVIRVEVVEQVTGLSIQRPIQYIPYLPAGNEQTFAVGLYGEANLGKGIARLKIKVTGKGLEDDHAEFEVNIPCGLKDIPEEVPQSTVLTMMQPNLLVKKGTRSDPIPTSKAAYSVRMKVITRKDGVAPGDIVTYRNRRKLNYQKSLAKLYGPFISKNKFREYEYVYKVPLVEGENVIFLEYDGIITDSFFVNFQPRKPNLHILTIGVPGNNLEFPANDAFDIGRELMNQKGRSMFGNVYLKSLITSNETTRDAIGIAFEQLRDDGLNQKIMPRDYLVIFISSHGLKGKDGRFYLMPSKCDPRYESTMVDYNNIIAKYLNPINCKKILFIDACHSGGQDSTYNNKSISDPLLSQTLKTANGLAEGMCIISSSSEEQVSFEHSSWSNGAFSEVLMEAFTNESVFVGDKEIQADIGTWGEGEQDEFKLKPDGILTLNELILFLQRRVPYLVKSKINEDANQFPELNGDLTSGRLPIIILP